MSEEIALAAGDLAYWQRRAETAEADAAALRAAAEIVRSEYNTLLESPLPDVYATMQLLRWPIGHLAIIAESHNPGAALLAVLEAARAWRAAVETLNGVYAAEQALLAALKASEG